MGLKGLLKRFRSLFKESFYLTSSKSPNVSQVKEEEELSRFVTDRKWIDRITQSVRYAAFVPHHGETSVFRTSGLKEADILVLGKNQTRAHRIYGRGALQAAEIFSEGLRVEPEISTHFLHANILGWPGDMDPLQMQLAVNLANKAVLTLYPKEQSRSRP